MIIKYVGQDHWPSMYRAHNKEMYSWIDSLNIKVAASALSGPAPVNGQARQAVASGYLRPAVYESSDKHIQS